jgi:hypothetical protein
MIKKYREAILASMVRAAACMMFVTFGMAIVLGCSMIQVPEHPRSIVSPGMYILVGEVIGYTGPISDPNNFRGTAVGLRLKIVESIHFPYFQNDYVDLFIFGHGTDCFPEAKDGNRTPIGTRYRLALGEARLVANRSGSHVRLESDVFSRLAIDESMYGFSTTAKSEFDYKKDFRQLADKFMAPGMEDRRRWLDDFLYIEASKDLLRLQRARSEQERMSILERLLYCPNINYRRLFSSEVGRPLRYEEGDFSGLIAEQRNWPKAKMRPRKLSKRENELLAERTRLENSGELNTWKR